MTKPILYGSLLLIFLFLGAITGLCFQNYDEIKKRDDALGLAETSDDEKVALAALVIAGLLFVCFIICLCCTWKAIALGAAIMETASEFIGQNKKLVFFPFLAYLLCVPVLLWWIVTAIFVYGLGEPVFL